MSGTLISPGVSVTIIDESQYASSGPGTIPLIVMATAANKASPSGSGLAPGSLTSAANMLYLATSQQDLITNFGAPTFQQYQGTVLQGDETNEWGLLAAYSYLGIANQAYILRANIDTSQLLPSAVAPVGPPVAGQYWLNLTTTTWGVFQSNGNTSPGLAWVSQTVLVPTQQQIDDNNVPLQSFGANGQFAVVPWTTNNLIYQKGIIGSGSATWYQVGSANWITAFTTNGNAPVYYETSNAQYPSGSIQGSVWIKGNPSRNGASWQVYYYNSATSSFVLLSAPFYQFNSALADGASGKDTAAATGLGVPSTGSVYVGYDPSTGIQQLRRWNGTYWAALSYVASLTAPTTPPAAGTLWYDSPSSFAADIMVSNGTEWKGYRNVYPETDVNGIQISASAPTTQSTGSALVANDLWLDSSDQENYPVIYTWNTTLLRWTLVDNTDHESPFGIIFNDARQDSGVAFTGIVNGGSYNYQSTSPSDLVLSDYVDPDAPNPELYPAGLMLFNTRASNNLVKIWYPTYFNPGPSPTNFDPNDDYTVNSYTVGNTAFTFPPLTNPGRWVNAAGNDSANNLIPFMGRKSQRQMIVTALRATITANQDIRSELVYFNLIACPGYCELIDDMTTLNTDQNQVSFIVGDTPMRLTPDSTSLLNWANNAANVAYTCENGLAPGSYSAAAGDYIGLYYPWGLGTDLSGNEVMIPPSSIALSTIAYNDQVSYPWFAPAGFNRGLISNASSVGYLNADGSYTPVILNQGQRDTLYGARPSGCQINPFAYIPGRGLVVYGQKTLSGDASALDRINVARLVNYIKYNIDNIVKPYLFEQNDSITQTAAKNTVESFFNNLVQLRALGDYAVKCDSDNNTPDRVDQNQLWIDCAILPIKAVEFIYVPIRIINGSTTAAAALASDLATTSSTTTT